jgi:transcriptional regulator with XRE-family HTH domain
MQNRIGILRVEKGLSLTDLARLAGTTKAQIQKLERGDRRLSLQWMSRLARALDVKMSDLLPEDTVSCQHGPEEREILDIVSQLPVEDRVALVRIANDLLVTFRRWEKQQGKPEMDDLPALLTDPDAPSLKPRRRRA